MRPAEAQTKSAPDQRARPSVQARVQTLFAAGVVTCTLLLCGVPPPARAAEVMVDERGPRVTLSSPEWLDLAGRYARNPDGVAYFEERRFFPFRKDPVLLKGEVRVSREHGLSMHYTAPEERIVILDDKGVVLREAGGDRAPPADPRAQAINQAMFNILRLDFPALDKAFEVYGARATNQWYLTLVAREESVRRSVGDILVIGDDVSVRRVELRRSAKQHVDIEIAPARTEASFTAEELKRFFRSRGANSKR